MKYAGSLAGWFFIFIEAIFRSCDYFLNGYWHRRAHHTLILIFLIVPGVLYFKKLISDKYIISILILLVFIHSIRARAIIRCITKDNSVRSLSMNLEGRKNGRCSLTTAAANVCCFH